MVEDDSRKKNAFLRKKNIKFYMFDLKSEKPLKLVEEDLESDCYKVQKVTTMKERKGPLFIKLVDTGKEHKSIFYIKHCFGLVIQVNSLNWGRDVIQYYSCQMFGDIQENCYSKYKYIKCGSVYPTHEYTKPVTIRPRSTPDNPYKKKEK